jgi:hypothetical protein
MSIPKASASKGGLAEIKEPELTVFSEEDLQAFIDTYVYKGFDRAAVRELAGTRMSPKMIIILAAATALRGPIKAAELSKAKIPANGHQGEMVLTCAKLLAAFPDKAATVLRRIPNLTKRVPSSPIPAWLQFPSAAALDLDKLGKDYARLHKEWARTFSGLIRGTFKEDLYDLTARDKVLLSPEDLRILQS